MQSEIGNIGANIRKMRKFRCWTQEELARQANISRIALIHIESGKASPTLETLSAISSVFQIPLTRLFVQKNTIDSESTIDSPASYEDSYFTQLSDNSDLNRIIKILSNMSEPQIAGMRKAVEAISTVILEKI